jgi:hypothetical protein
MRAPETCAYLDLERAVLRLDEDRIAAIGSEWLSGLIAVGLTIDDIRGFAERAMNLFKGFLRGLTNAFAAIPLSAGIPASDIAAGLQIAARVITSSDDEFVRAFCIFLSVGRPGRPPLPLDNRGPVHLQGIGPDLTGILFNNIFLLREVLGPLLERLFFGSPGFVFNADTGRLSSTTHLPVHLGFGGTSAQQIRIFTISVSIDDVNEAFVMESSFEYASSPYGDGITLAVGTATIRFGLRWDEAAQTIVAAGVPATQDEPEVQVHVDVSAGLYILSAIAFALLFGVLGLAIGGPVGLVIGAAVGVVFGLAAANTGALIASIVATGFGGRRARGGLIGTPLPFSLPFLAPTIIRTQAVRLDDLVVVGRPLTPSIQIETSGLQVSRRTVIGSTALGQIVRLTWSGEFTARTLVFQEPLRYTWTLGDRHLDGEGEISLLRGSIRFRADGAHCHLTTTHGSFLLERLCVTVEGNDGFRMAGCRLIRAEGEREEVPELFVPPDISAESFRMPPRLIPDPPFDILSNPEAVQGVWHEYVSAIERGMGVQVFDQL